MTIFSKSNGTMTLSTVMVIDGKNCMIRVSNPELFGSSDNYKTSTKIREMTIYDTVAIKERFYYS